MTFHEGESHAVLPALLDEFARTGKNVDFALIDGDHSPIAVRDDLRLLLDSPAVTRTAILLHDSFSPWVREGIALAGADGHPKVVLCQLDFVLAVFGPAARSRIRCGAASPWFCR